MFAAALADHVTVGLTFGGLCGSHHGLNVSGGTSRAIVLSYRTELARAAVAIVGAAACFVVAAFGCCLGYHLPGLWMCLAAGSRLATIG
jgi:hypothetical protein